MSEETKKLKADQLERAKVALQNLKPFKGIVIVTDELGRGCWEASPDFSVQELEQWLEVIKNESTRLKKI
jgi:hypothetical protein